MVVDGAVDGGEFLECLHPPKSEHRPFPSSERLMRVLGSIVDPPPYLLPVGISDLVHRRWVGPQPVGDNGTRRTRFKQRVGWPENLTLLPVP
jgi:hypothetical protein